MKWLLEIETTDIFNTQTRNKKYIICNFQFSKSNSFQELTSQELTCQDDFNEINETNTHNDK